MRPPTRPRPDARDTSYSVGPAAAPGGGERSTRAHSGAQTHREERAATEPGRVRSRGENCYRWRIRVQAGTSGDAAARRRGAGRPRALPRVAHHRLGGFARRRFARECRRAGSCAELLLGGRRCIGRLLARPAAGRPDRGDRPFQPSYEDRPGAPDRVFAAVDDEGLRTARRRLERGTRPGGSGERGRPPSIT